MTGTRFARRSRLPTRSGAPFGRLPVINVFSATLLLTALFALLLAAYLLTGSSIVLLVTVAVVAVGSDRIVRLHPEARFHGASATLLYLFVPSLYALALSLLLVQLNGWWSVPALLAVLVLFAIVVNAEYLTVEPTADTYEAARLLLLVAIIIIALAIFAVVFTSSLSLMVGTALVGGAAFLLTVDMLRELEAETSDLMVHAGAVAALMAEARLVVHVLSLAGLLAGVFLFIIFYATTGLVQSRVNGKLDRQTWMTYAGVASAGFLFVIVARLINR